MKIIALLGAATLLLQASSASAATSACDNAYLPLKVGNSWTWNTPGKTFSLRVVKLSHGVATLATDNPDGKDQPPLTVDLACSADGVDFDLSRILAQLQGAGGIHLNLVKTSGTTLAAAARFKSGESWDSSHTLQMLTAGTLLGIMESKATLKVLGVEKVKVPAGEFEAVKIQSEADTLATRAGGGTPSAPLHSTDLLWFAKGVGLVRQSTVIAGQPAVTITELASYSH